MSFYLFHGRYSTDALRALVDEPQDREKIAGEMMSAMGAKLHHLFFCFGEEQTLQPAGALTAWQMKDSSLSSSNFREAFGAGTAAGIVEKKEPCCQLTTLENKETC